jgi:hypothetical protein
VEHDVPGVVHDTDVHGAGMQINAPGKGVLLRVEAPEVSSSLCVRVSRSQHPTVGC